jgi:predicted Ser/Thr protein kinase
MRTIALSLLLTAASSVLGQAYTLRLEIPFGEQGQWICQAMHGGVIRAEAIISPDILVFKLPTPGQYRCCRDVTGESYTFTATENLFAYHHSVRTWRAEALNKRVGEGVLVLTALVACYLLYWMLKLPLPRCMRVARRTGQGGAPTSNILPRLIARAFPDAEDVGLLGQGGVASVYQMVHPRYGCVAMKVLRDGLAHHVRARARIYHEARVLQRLRPFGVVPLVYGRAPRGFRQPFIVMESLAGGRPLAALIPPRGMGTAALPYVLRLAHAVGLLHRAGVVHRDLSPDNVYCMPDGSIRIIDFDLARVPGYWRNPFYASGAGKSAYAAPEQWDAFWRAGRAADVYAVGIIAWEAITGRPPFRTPLEHRRAMRDPSQLMAFGVPAGTSSVICGWLAPRRSQRMSLGLIGALM